MKKILITLLATGLAMGAMTDSVSAQKRGKGHRLARLFAKLDANKDGKLEKSEVPAKLWARLSKADANNDGAVTMEELKAAAKKRKKGGKKKKG
jgi:Ca2+-binding EF-hand superfamily protein